MIRHLSALCLALLLVPQDSPAQTRERIGYGRLIINDHFVDRQDRWRSGSLSSSRIWGYGWDGVLPQQPGDIIELRLGAEIIAPANLVRPAKHDRPFAGVLSAGLHTHFMRSGIEFALGTDLVVVGQQTRLDRLQEAIHDRVGMVSTSGRARANQIEDAYFLSFVAEAGREFELAQAVTLRPFVEARAGAETMLRAGVDATFGGLGHGELQVRDTVSGHRYRTTPGGESGLALVLGADFAAVDSSVYLPASSGVVASDTRNRYRGGVLWQGQVARVFYGVTYLDKEFVGQKEGQMVGSIRLDFYF